MISPLIKLITVDGFFSEEQAINLCYITKNLNFTEKEFGLEIDQFNMVPENSNDLFSNIFNTNIIVDEEHSGIFRIPRHFVHFESFDSVNEWILKFKKRLEKEDIASEIRTQKTLLKNPLIIPRNHLLLNVIKEANLGNNGPLLEYWNALQEPYSLKWVKSVWAREPSPEQCGLKCSCSS